MRNSQKEKESEKEGMPERIDFYFHINIINLYRYNVNIFWSTIKFVFTVDGPDSLVFSCMAFSFWELLFYQMLTHELIASQLPIANCKYINPLNKTKNSKCPMSNRHCTNCTLTTLLYYIYNVLYCTFFQIIFLQSIYIK